MMQKSVSVKPLSESKEWKVLERQIAEANKDPAFREAVERFIEIASNHSK